MQVLLTFTGFHDPFSKGGSKDDARAGPILTVVADGKYDKVYLFSTPKMADVSAATAQAIQERNPDTVTEIIEIPLRDPTNYIGILRQLRSNFKKINNVHPDASYSISVASGTPQMHACWLLLAASGEIPATVLQSFPPEFVPEGKSQVRMVDLSKQGFPAISIQPSTTGSDTESEDIIDVCRELGIVGEDPAFLEVLEQAKIFAEYDDIHILLLGETGSGKEYITNFLHRMGPRAGKPLITVNCSSIPKELVESQLFGHKKGSFTGATSHSLGKFQSADGGVLFLDELGELPLEAQAKLLRALDQGEIEPIGAPKPLNVNVRVIAATNKNLREMVSAGTFRDDLYQRFGSTLDIPALRDRKIDIPKLALHILNSWNAKHKKERRLSAEALTALTKHAWPGNVRELQKVIVQSAMLCPKAVIGEKDLRFEIPLSTNIHAVLPEPEEGFDLTAYLDELKLRLIERALKKTNGNQRKAADLLGQSPQAVNQFLKRRENQ